MKSIYSSLFGESPATQQAREARDLSFQDMLKSRRQSAEQARTDDVQMARYNALGNLLTTMVQPIGWAAGGTTGGGQKYDDRQYLNAFNRAVKATDDLRNIGTLEDEYRFKLAEQNYNRMQAMDDAERQQQRMIERQELAEQGRMERDQKKYEQQMELQQQKDDAKMQLEQYRQTHKVTNKRTGLGIQDKILLEQVKAYNAQVAKNTYSGTFDEWLTERGYKVEGERPVTRSNTPAQRPSASTSTNRPTINWAN